jgi:hypothetical protein
MGGRAVGLGVGVPGGPEAGCLTAGSRADTPALQDGRCRRRGGDDRARAGAVWRSLRSQSAGRKLVIPTAAERIEGEQFGPQRFYRGSNLRGKGAVPAAAATRRRSVDSAGGRAGVEAKPEAAPARTTKARRRGPGSSSAERSARSRSAGRKLAIPTAPEASVELGGGRRVELHARHSVFAGRGAIASAWTGGSWSSRGWWILRGWMVGFVVHFARWPGPREGELAQRGWGKLAGPAGGS